MSKDLSRHRTSKCWNAYGTTVWGVIGGMGPYASLHFMSRVYRQLGPISTEQRLPSVVLISEPRIEDRSIALRSARGVSGLAKRIDELCQRAIVAGAERLLICCITAHIILPYLSPNIHRRLYSLVTASLQEIKKRPGKYLLLSSVGTRNSQLFERHPLWSDVCDRIVVPTSVDQRLVTRVISAVKRGCRTDEAKVSVLKLVEKYRATGCVAGCTEIPVALEDLGPRYGSRIPVDVIDPLESALREIGCVIPEVLDSHDKPRVSNHDL